MSELSRITEGEESCMRGRNYAWGLRERFGKAEETMGGIEEEGAFCRVKSAPYMNCSDCIAGGRGGSGACCGDLYIKG